MQDLHKMIRIAAGCLTLGLFAISSVVAQTTAVSSSVPNAPTPNVSLPGTQSPFLGSEPEGKASAEVLQIDFTDAINRGLRNNLGLLLAHDATETARGERWKELSDLLPNISARVAENVQTESLAALGFNKLFPVLSPAGSGGNLPRLLPAFNYFDARVSWNQSIFSFKDIEKERAASESVKAARFTYKDAREIVVLAVGNAYLQAIATAARVETAEAQVNSGQALFDKASDQKKAGLSP